MVKKEAWLSVSAISHHTKVFNWIEVWTGRGHCPTVPSWEHEIVQKLYVWWGIQNSFCWNTGVKNSSWNTTPHHNLPPPTLTLGTIQSSNVSLETARWSSVICHCLECISTSPVQLHSSDMWLGFSSSTIPLNSLSPSVLEPVWTTH